MKIGILTFHCAHNYGAVLQAYALQEYLKSSGNDVEIPDYRPEYLTRPYVAFPRPYLRNATLKQKILRLGAWGLFLPWALALVPARLARRRGFEAFISGRLALSRERFFRSDAVARHVADAHCDALVFGSDQIWSPAHTNGGDAVFLGDFPVPAGTRKIAYAASAGAASATLGENPKFADALKNFDAISVREANLAESLQPKTDKEISVAVDPTLLVDRAVWEKLAVAPAPRKRPYVLVYKVAHVPEADRVARELAAQLGADVVSIWAGYGRRAKNALKAETPEQFVGWFREASCVVTTSFHGTAFGLIFEKPLYYVGCGAAGENRPRQILGALGLTERIVPATAPTPAFSAIDWEKVTRETGGLDALRARSREFLARALGGNVGNCDKMGGGKDFVEAFPQNRIFFPQKPAGTVVPAGFAVSANPAVRLRRAA